MKTAIANLIKRGSYPALGQRTAVDVEEELRFHIDMLESKYQHHGMPAAEAHAAAMTRFGSLERIKRQCVNIRRRSSLLQRVVKTFTILFVLGGLAINFLSDDYKVERIGTLIIAIAIMVRLLLYVRGSTFLPGTKTTSIITDTPDDGPNPRAA